MDGATLTRMANDIARNFAALGEARGVAATAEHITKFWDPRMKAAIAGLDVGALHPIAAKALRQVRAISSQVE